LPQSAIAELAIRVRSGRGGGAAVVLLPLGGADGLGAVLDVEAELAAGLAAGLETAFGLEGLCS
jgi:hypothetical protein